MDGIFQTEPYPSGMSCSHDLMSFMVWSLPLGSTDVLVFQLQSHSFLWGHSLQCFHCHAAFFGRREQIPGVSWWWQHHFVPAKNRVSRAISHSCCYYKFWERSWCEDVRSLPRNSKILWWPVSLLLNFSPWHFPPWENEKIVSWSLNKSSTMCVWWCAWWWHCQVPGNDHSKHRLSFFDVLHPGLK